MFLSSGNSVVESGWRERAGERSEPVDSTVPHEAAPALPIHRWYPKAEKAKRRRFSASEKRRILAALVWHDLRATFGTRLGEAGFDAFTIAPLWDTLTFTQRLVMFVRRRETNVQRSRQQCSVPNRLSTNWPHAHYDHLRLTL